MLTILNIFIIMPQTKMKKGTKLYQSRGK